MIEQIESLHALYPIIIGIEEADEYWEMQVEGGAENLCYMRLTDDETFISTSEIWELAYAHNALKGMVIYCLDDGRVEYVLAFPTKTDAMMWKLAHGGA